MRHPDYPFWSFVSLLAVLVPAPWHWRARNISTICLIAWLSLYHGIAFTNSLVWADNYADVSPIWCDISGRILLIIPFAIPLCSLAQMRRLASVASPRRPRFISEARHYRILEELSLCVGGPILMMPILYVVQGHRYDIIESVGCAIPDVLSWPSITLRYIIPVAVSTLSLLYACVVIRWFLIRRLHFRSLLTGSGLTTGRYLRLLGLAISDSILIMFSTLFNAIVRIVYEQDPIEPYTSWAYIHADFSLISQFPEEAQPRLFSSDVIAVPFYMGPLYALMFFVFFGFGDEAITEYLALWNMTRRVLQKWGLLASIKKPLPVPALGSAVMTLTGSAWIDEEDLPKADFRHGDDNDGKPPSAGITVFVETCVV